MDPSVFIDGTPAAELGGIKSLGFTRSFAGGQGGGFRDARLTLDLEPGFQHPSLRLNAPVELRHGADSLGKGRIVSIDRNTWEIVVDGIVRLGEDYESRTDVGVPAGLATGLPAAIGRGLPWKIDPSLVLPGDVVGQSMQSVTDALNDLATQQSKAWLIDDETLHLVADPTTPSLMLMATDNPNSSTDGLVSVVTAKYAGAVDESGNPALIDYVPVEADDAPKRVERTIDLTGNGAMTAADATAQAKAALTSGATSPLTESVSVAAGTLFTAAGDDLTDILCTVREGQMVRQLDWVNPDGSPGLYRDWIIGGVDWSTDGGLVLTPVGGTAATLTGTIIDLRQGVDSAQGTADSALAVGTPDYLQSLITPSSVSTQGATMPASAVIGDIWINPPNGYVCTTPYTSDGTMANWTQAIDPRTVALIGATATAVFAADNANAAAQTAQASADGKNTITYAASAPTSTTPGVIGDTAFVFSGGQITAQYKQPAVSGSTYTWSSMQLNSAVIANLDVGKITGAVANFVYAAITQLDVLTINASTTTWTADLTPTLQPQTTITGTGITAVNAYNGASMRLKIKSGLAVTGDIIYASEGISTGGNITADGSVAVGGNLTIPNAPTTTLSPNAFISSPSGTVFLTSGSSRTVKHSIEPADLDAHLAAFYKVGLFAFHYLDDAEQRTVLAPMVEDMLAEGLSRYVDFDDDGRPFQPAWQQIHALTWAALQSQNLRINTLESVVLNLAKGA
jgi:hypothetical protein